VPETAPRARPHKPLSAPGPASGAGLYGLTAGEAWPLVNAWASLMLGAERSLATSAAPVGLNLMAEMGPRDIGRNTFSSSVMRARLYSHGLVMEDPVIMAPSCTCPRWQAPGTCLVGSSRPPSLRWPRSRHCWTAVVQAFFVTSPEGAADRTLAERMNAELQAERQPGPGFTVASVWDAFETQYLEGLSPWLQELWRMIRAGDRNPPLDLLQHPAPGVARGETFEAAVDATGG